MVSRRTAVLKGKTVLAIAAVAGCVFYYMHGQAWIERTYAYPFTHREVVVEAAEENHISPALVAGVILAESKFNERAQSAPGAIGLMQLMPDTADWIVKSMKDPNVTDADLKEPATNIQIGSWYLAYLLKQYNGNEILALAAYNAGRGHVEEWMHQNDWDDSFSDVDKIPFPETREYVKAVLANEAQYKELYMGQKAQ